VAARRIPPAMTISDAREVAGEPPAMDTHQIRDGNGEVPEALSADAVKGLLIGYGLALDTAADLPVLARIATRSMPRTILDALRFLPRPTIGTSTMVTLHVRRSTAALVQRYDRMAATRGLTDDEKQANELVKTFYKSVAAPRWTLIISAGLIAVFIVSRIIAVPVSKAAAGALKWISGQIDTGVVTAEIDAIIRSVSSVPTAGSFMDLFAQFAKAGAAEFVALIATIAVVGYLVLRPLSSAFRIKRIIFNLAASGEVDLDRTTTTWNIPRSVGLYQSEQAAFTRLGARAPREFNLDLWISVVPAGVLLWALWPGIVVEHGEKGLFWVLGVVLAATLAGARIAWLVQTGRLRRRTMSPIDPPAGFRLSSGANGVVGARSVVETASLGLVSSLLLWGLPLNAHFVVPSPVWVRLVCERREFERALRPSTGIWKRLPRVDLWLALGSAILLWVVPPIPLAVHLTRLSRMQPTGVGSARRTRSWLVPLAAAVTVMVALAHVDVMSTDHPSAVQSGWLAFTHIAAFAMFTAAFAAVQNEHNALAAHVGEPLPFDDPIPAGALPRETYTSWIRRVLAALIDMVPILILGAIAAGAFWIPAPGCKTAYANCELAWADSLAGSMLVGLLMLALMLAALIMMAAYWIWNWGYRQGRTGSSVGKSVLRFRVVSERTGRPIGFWCSIVRTLLHIVDCLPLCIGFLFPLCDAKRRTVADKIMSTVCLPIPTDDISEAHGPRTPDIPVTKTAAL
jgi:RDD family